VERVNQPFPEEVVRRWGRTANERRGRRGVGARYGRPWSRRASAAALAVALLALAAVPSTTALRSRAKVVADHSAVRVPSTSTSDRVRFEVTTGGAATAATTTTAAPAPPAPATSEAVIAPPPASFDAPPAPPAAPPTLLHSAASAGGGVWAVVIGIDDYPGRGSDLRASVYDANTVDYTLAAYGVPADRRLVLRNTQATAAVIADSLRWLVARAGPDAAAVFFYAGHVRKIGRGAEAIVAADGKLVTDRTVADLLRPLRSRAWIVMASCYGGGFTEVLGPGRILTGAAGPNSLAYENATYANSYLVEYVFERAMMNGHAPESAERAFDWAHAALRRDHPNRVPVSHDWLEGELRLGTPPRPAPSSSPPPPSSPPPSSPPTTSAPPPEDDDDGDCLLSLGSIANCDD